MTKSPPAAVLIKKECGLETASGEPNKKKVATLSQESLRKIAETKMPDLNANDIDAAMRIIEGTARNMGVSVKGVNDKEMAEQAAEAQKEEIEAKKREEELAALEAESKETNVEAEVITEKKDEEPVEDSENN